MFNSYYVNIYIQEDIPHVQHTHVGDARELAGEICTLHLDTARKLGKSMIHDAQNVYMYIYID